MDVSVRIMTSEGRGAIAVVRVWGVRAVEIVDAVFQPSRGKSMAETPIGRLRLGRAGLGLGDEVVAVRLPARIPIVEIQTHGGTAAVRSVVSALEAAGARPCTGSEAESTQIDDPIAVQARADLPHAPTLRTAEILLDQAQGALRRELDGLRLETQVGTRPPLARLDALIDRAAVGLRLIAGWKVVIGGRPNVGKSRLFNALAGFARTIVDPTPGVTRDVVTFRTAMGGWPVDLADTAGLRGTEDAIEGIGIARARREQQVADLVLLVLDRSEPLQPMDRELIESTSRALVIANKSDLPAAWDHCEAFEGSSSVLTVSAESGEGIAALIAAIGGRLVPNPPAPGEPVPFRSDQLRGLEHALAFLSAGDHAGAEDRLAMIGRLDAGGETRFRDRRHEAETGSC
jgi:tRNA modification GTPase